MNSKPIHEQPREANTPDFYLASTEGYDLEAPRRCWQVRRLSTMTRDDLLLVRVEPAIIGQKYGLGGEDIDAVIVAPRHQGQTFFPIRSWPMSVHVALLKARRVAPQRLQDDDLELIAWAELHPTEEDALQASSGDRKFR